MFRLIGFKNFSKLRYYNCNGDSVIHSWCGPQMSFDADHQRCEMAVAIYCIDGDRPDWEPPENCRQIRN